VRVVELALFDEDAQHVTQSRELTADAMVYQPSAATTLAVTAHTSFVDVCVFGLTLGSVLENPYSKALDFYTVEH
jgi:hypothetical protein